MAFGKDYGDADGCADEKGYDAHGGDGGDQKWYDKKKIPILLTRNCITHMRIDITK